MGLFSGRKSNHRRLDSADQDNEVASHESSGMQAVVVNVTVPEGAEFGAEFSSDNHIISIAKDSICFKTQLKEGDLVVQINGIGTETKKVADLMQGEVQLSITVLRRRTTNNRKSASSSSADEDTTGRQSEVKKGGGLADDDH